VGSGGTLFHVGCQGLERRETGARGPVLRLVPMAMRLYAMSFSPYSEKARWALDHHRLPYALHEHVPMAGELLLRWRAGVWSERVSVPLAVEGDVVLRSSTAIAQHADRVGAGASLRSDADGVVAWDARGDAALGAARVLLLGRTLADREALRDSLPSWIPGAVRGASTPIAASATRFLGRKYGAKAQDPEVAAADVRAALTELRDALGGRPYLLDGLSYADIAMAVVLQMVSPVDEAFIPLGQARRRAWREPGMARDFADLVEWRDRLYAEHRRS
jgi:glutathione S-transferase